MLLFLQLFTELDLLPSIIVLSLSENVYTYVKQRCSHNKHSLNYFWLNWNTLEKMQYYCYIAYKEIWRFSFLELMKKFHRSKYCVQERWLMVNWQKELGWIKWLLTLQLSVSCVALFILLISEEVWNLTLFYLGLEAFSWYSWSAIVRRHKSDFSQLPVVSVSFHTVRKDIELNAGCERLCWEALLGRKFSVVCIVFQEVAVV